MPRTSKDTDREAARLEALRQYGILDTPPEEAFDDIANLAAGVFAAPIAMISLVDERRQFFKARVGIDLTETPRKISFCASTLENPGLCVIRDTLLDERFASNPLVTGGPRIRFYAAASLVTPDGLALGTVCVADRVPRDPSPRQMEVLRALANQVMTHLELRRHVTELARTIAGLTKTEAALRDSEDRHRLLFESIPLPTWVFDRETFRILAVNDAAVRHYGYSRDEFLAMTVFDVRPVEDIPAFLERLRNAPENQGFLTSGRHKKKDGSVIDVEIAAHNISIGGRPARLGVANDVTERRRAEESRDETETRYRLVQRATRDAIWDWDLATNEVTWNEGVTTLFGYSGPIDRDISWWEQRLHPEERERVVAGINAKIAGTAEFWSDEYRFHRADGTWANILDRGYVMREPSGRPVRMVGAMIDLTEQKRLEEQLRHAQKMDAVGKLAGGVAHDFNNILTAIVGYCDLIQERLDPADPLLEEIVEIRKAGERASSLTQHLLAFSRRQVLQPRALDLNAIVLDMEMIMRRLIGEHIELKISADPTLWPVKADPGQIGQVIMNLAVNARDAMPAGGVLTIETSNGAMTRPDARVPSPVPPGDYVTLTVGDTGSGIEREVMDRIFEPFFTTKERGKGTGLGLSTVYGIVKQSGGDVWVSSVVGTGTVFKILLPRASGAAFVEVPVVSKSVSPSRGTETILLVEDDEMVRRVSFAVLRGLGYLVLQARDGEEAMRLAESHDGPIHVMVSDVVLPGMSGPDLAKRLASIRPTTGLLFISGYMDEAVARSGVLDTGAAFLQKPFTAAQLHEKIREVLAQNPSTDAAKPKPGTRASREPHAFGAS